MCLFKKKKKIKKMTLEEFLKTRQEDEIELLSAMFKYIEGQISFSEIFEYFKSNSELVDRIYLNRNLRQNIIDWDVSLLRKYISKKELSLLERVDFTRIIKTFFGRYYVEFSTYDNPDEVFIVRLNSYFPEWIYPDKEYFLGIMDKEMPKGLNEAEQDLWCKNKVLELYQYEKEPPEWAQDEIWPMYKGEPMIFRYQKEIGEKVTYHFIDKSGEKKKTITQYY